MRLQYLIGLLQAHTPRLPIASDGEAGYRNRLTSLGASQGLPGRVICLSNFLMVFFEIRHALRPDDLPEQTKYARVAYNGGRASCPRPADKQGKIRLATALAARLVAFVGKVLAY